MLTTFASFPSLSSSLVALQSSHYILAFDIRTAAQFMVGQYSTFFEIVDSLYSHT